MAILTMLAGAGVGMCAAVGLYILGFGVEVLNCGCQILQCNLEPQDALPFMWQDGSFTATMVFCLIAGAVIGLAYGLLKMKIENDEKQAAQAAVDAEAQKQQRIKNAAYLKRKAKATEDACVAYRKCKTTLVSDRYYADEQMEAIARELSAAAQLKGRLDAAVAAFEEKEGEDT